MKWIYPGIWLNRENSMSINKSSWLWAAIFSLLFLLSQDLWFGWDSPLQLGPWNFPARIYYFVFLQFLLAALLVVFLSRRSNRNSNDSE